MNNHMILNKKITSDDVDAECRLAAHGMLAMFQLAATEHSKDLGVDYFTLREKSGAYWVITRVRIKFFNYVGWGDSIKAVVWAAPKSRIMFDWRMIAETDGGKPAAAVASEWCMLDFETHAVRRASTTCFPTELEVYRNDCGAGDFERIDRTTDGAEFCFDYPVRYADIDIHKHTNNVVYAKLAMNTFSCDFLKAHPVETCEIHFLNESHEGDVLSVYRQNEGKSYRILGINKNTGVSVFAVRLKTVELKSDDERASM